MKKCFFCCHIGPLTKSGLIYRHGNKFMKLNKTPGWFYCIDCGEFVGDVLPIPASDFPDYTQDPHNGRLMDWMREEAKWWEFDCWLISEHSMTMVLFNLEPRQEQVALIAKAIREGVL